jgi:hypothetical protein
VTNMRQVCGRPGVLVPCRGRRVWGVGLLVAGLLLAPIGTAAAGLSAPADTTGSVVLRPDGDIVRAWTGGTPGSAAAALDDPVTQPTAVPATDYIYARDPARSTEVTLSTTNLHGGFAQVTAWYFANTGPGTALRVEVVQATTVLAAATLPVGSGFGWRSLTGPLLAGLNQAALNDLRLRFTSIDGGDTNVRAAYVDLTYQPCTPSYGGFGPGTWPPACWRPYGSTSPLNRKLPPNPRPINNSESASTAIVARVLGDISHDNHPGNLAAGPSGTGGEPTYYPQATDPLVTLHCVWQPCAIEGHQIRIPATAAPEGGWAATADRHLTIVDQATGWEYDLWQVQGSAPPPPGATLTFTNGGRTRVTGDCDGLAADGRNCEPTTPGNGTAAHLGGLAGRVRVEELQAGRIEHALTIVIDCDSGTAVYPAKHAGRSCAELGKPTADAPPMGALFQLDLTPAQIDALPVLPWHKVFLHAMAEYGMYLADTGASGLFSIEAEAGNQYTTLGQPDPWLTYGQANWELWTHDGTYDYVGKFFNPHDPDPDQWWLTHIWNHLRILDPCIAQTTC